MNMAIAIFAGLGFGFYGGFKFAMYVIKTACRHPERSPQLKELHDTIAIALLVRPTKED